MKTSALFISLAASLLASHASPLTSTPLTPTPLISSSLPSSASELSVTTSATSSVALNSTTAEPSSSTALSTASASASTTTSSDSTSTTSTSTTSTSSSPSSTSTISEAERRAAFPFNPGFDIEKVAALAEQLPTHSWEFGSAAEALLELYNPDISVFGSRPFPVPDFPKSQVRSLQYADDRITIGVPPNIFADGDGAVGDPFSLGVAAVMLGKTESRFIPALEAEVEYLLTKAPRWYNGAISHRADVAELWSDWMYMVPPALAFYAVDTHNSSLLQETIKQCEHYREALQANLTDYVPYKGVWEHIVGPQSPEHGLWSTGNAWAIGGMSRVLATIMKAPKELTAGWCEEAIYKLTTWIKEILDGALASPPDDGLLRNYLNDTETAHGFGEISGTSLMAAVSYRMAVLLPETFGYEYVEWADNVIKTLAGTDRNGNPHVKPNGVVTPAVNPLGWLDTDPWTTGSPEGNNFVVLMYAAWRDCIKAGVCSGYGIDISIEVGI